MEITWRVIGREEKEGEWGTRYREQETELLGTK